jgi:AraC-like DNA-binding protein
MNPEIPSFVSTKVQKGDYFFLNLNPPNGECLTVVGGGMEVCGEDYEVDRSTFPYFGLEYISTGNCEVTLGNKTSLVKSGQLFAYAPNFPLHLRRYDDKTLTKYFVDFTGLESSQLLESLSQTHGGIADLSYSPWIAHNFQQLIKAGKSNQPQVCSLLLRLILAQIPLEPLRLPTVTRSSYEIYHRCLTLIDNNFATLNSLSDLAEQCHLSKAYLCRIFQKYHSEPPSKALTRRKMECAARLLFKGTGLIKRVALEVGYEDPYHFSRVFKLHFGVSPQHFMESARG